MTCLWVHMIWIRSYVVACLLYTSVIIQAISFVIIQVSFAVLGLLPQSVYCTVISIQHVFFHHLDGIFTNRQSGTIKSLFAYYRVQNCIDVCEKDFKLLCLSWQVGVPTNILKSNYDRPSFVVWYEPSYCMATALTLMHFAIDNCSASPDVAVLYH